MAQFDIITIDPPYLFSDSLKMSDVKRSANTQYQVMDIETIKKLPIKKLAKEDSLLALWVVSSQLQNGLNLMNEWGFRQTQTWVWVKTKNNPLENVISFIKQTFKNSKDVKADDLLSYITTFDLNNVLSFKMGRLFRQTHEICLLGVKGKIYNHLKNKSQRSVCFDVCQKHSQKTEILQDKLEIMFPGLDYIEIFARRQRKNWICVGNESSATKDQDIFESLDMLIQM